MSHFTVVVALPPSVQPDRVTAALTAALAPFDESRGVEQVTDEDGDTYWHNPQAKWDWWVVGGRWRGYFAFCPGAAADDLVFGKSGAFDNAPKTQRGRTRPDGGRVHALDFTAMRAEAAEAASEDWHAYAAVVRGTPEIVPWREFVARYELEPEAYPIGRARDEYAAQERVSVARAAEPYRRSGACPVAIFDHLTCDEYVAQRRAAAVPGYATVRTDGRWLAAGRMGWFGMGDHDDDSNAYYTREANAYLDSLAADAWVVMVDAHI